MTDVDTLKATFRYCNESPSGLVRNVEIRSGYNDTVVMRRVGDRAGTFDGGYWKVKYKRRKMLVHRVVYELTFGKIPNGMIVDHIDGDTRNNAPINLRAISIAKNSRNAAMRVNNSTGKVGVSFHNTKERLYSKTQWNDPNTGQRKAKYFSVLLWGLIPAFAEACKFREEIIKELNAKGAGYTERHGT